MNGNFINFEKVFDLIYKKSLGIFLKVMEYYKRLL